MRTSPHYRLLEERCAALRREIAALHLKAQKAFRMNEPQYAEALRRQRDSVLASLQRYMRLLEDAKKSAR